MPGAKLRRIYRFSDTYGQSTSPLQDDADARISTDLRSFPLKELDRDFDIYGRENITHHILRLFFQLHDEVEHASSLPASIKKEFASTTTGIFINAAPRTSKENGVPFYVATSKNLRIVTTDLRGLSTVKDRIESLAHLPNENNNLYGKTEQFRSSYTARLLEEDHGLSLEEDNLSIIPDYPDHYWELSYVDRFGNLITYTKEPEKQWQEVLDAVKVNKGTDKEGTVKILIGDTSKRVQVSTSLRDADPERLVIYPNGDIEILRKWGEDENSRERLDFSAYNRFAKPEIGARIRLVSTQQD